MTTIDYRARLKAKPGQRSNLFKAATSEILGPDETSNVLQPLYNTGGMIFPFTPTVNVAGTANYDEFQFTQSNYRQLVYKNSSPSTLTVTGKFIAQTDQEARYMLAVMHFLRSITKSYTGDSSVSDGTAGTPPPVLLFDYNGTYMFQDVPVIVKSYNIQLDDNVDYVPVKITDTNISYVPTLATISVELDYQYNPKKLRTQFNLASFKQGKMISGSGNAISGNGGFI